MQHPDHVTVADAATKTAWPVTVSGMSFLGFPVADWLVVVTVIYTLVQLFVLIETNWPKWRARYGCKNKGGA